MNSLQEISEAGTEIMATITWTGGTGDFNAASLWSSDTVPGVADIAVVDASSGASSITLDGAESVAGLTLNDAAGSLTLSGVLSLNGGVLNLQAGTLTVTGTLSDGTLTADGGVLSVSGPSAALLGVTVEGTLDFGNSGAAVDVTGLGQSGLTQLDLGANTQIYFLDPEIFDGQTIEMAGGVLATDATDPNNGSLFFGSSLMARSRVRPRRHQRRTVAVTPPAGGTRNKHPAIVN